MCPTGTSPCAAVKGPDYQSAFEVLDADHDGKISPDDLRKFYPEFVCAASSSTSEDYDVIGTMISVADVNKDGFVEYEEFEKVLKGRERNGRHVVMEEAFRVMDRDGDGKVGHEDLLSFLKWAGFKSSDEDIKAMIRLGGGDEKHGVTFDGLLKILAV